MVRPLKEGGPVWEAVVSSEWEVARKRLRQSRSGMESWGVARKTEERCSEVRVCSGGSKKKSVCRKETAANRFVKPSTEKEKSTSSIRFWRSSRGFSPACALISFPCLFFTMYKKSFSYFLRSKGIPGFYQKFVPDEMERMNTMKISYIPSMIKNRY